MPSLRVSGAPVLQLMGIQPEPTDFYGRRGGGSGEENNAVGEPGANGGGVIILSAPTIIGGGGQLLSNGLQPTNPACAPDPLESPGDAGGGGAGPSS